jgi:hypothetical protein
MTLKSIIALVALCSSPAVACDTSFPNWHFGVDASTTMQADSGVGCDLRVENLNPASEIAKYGVASRPKHGVVKLGGSNADPAWTYIAKAKYTGPDDFVVYLSGHNSNTGNNGMTRFSVAVDVK